MSKQPKICVECKHFEDEDYVGFKCNRNVHKELNLVTGDVTTTGVLNPEMERKGIPPGYVLNSVIETCGPDGLFWESK